jgi:hypothetical protein
MKSVGKAYYFGMHKSFEVLKSHFDDFGVRPGIEGDLEVFS